MNKKESMKQLKVYFLLILLFLANINLQAQDTKNQFNPVNTGVISSLSIAPDSRVVQWAM